MIKNFLDLLRAYIPSPLKIVGRWLILCTTWDRWFNRSWSQEGEDQILRRIYEYQSFGFYVDVGAHHPKRFSNTYLFYKRGWRGINIDAMPGAIKAFSKDRPRDINVESGVGSVESDQDYYIFNEPALNGFSRDLSRERHEATSPYRIKEVIKVNVMPLCAILDKFLPKGQVIDFMSIDVEGLDYEVLKSNDWSKYRPTYVLVEVLKSSLNEIEQSEIGMLMSDSGYIIYAKCVNTVFFKNSSGGSG